MLQLFQGSGILGSASEVLCDLGIVGVGRHAGCELEGDACICHPFWVHISRSVSYFQDYLRSYNVESRGTQ